ncbi:heterokaryon incompatibility protein-domain-containing protein [Exophiala viscosa]|uniref:Heterokaryon incompatibility protein-domain-containing protein n=1 Tax=Exophiala viscosa TaxID=2486360 RepID=A0AAN6DQQ4_9EURO|nr:heterokaryon incompatibility protein-domain-containing protein [Exophiala viscosa]
MPAARSRRKRIHSGQPGNATQAWSRPQQLSEVSDIYQHRPLNDVSSIRLVELLPGLIGNELTLAMHHADLKEPPPYQALSYYWGDPAPVRTIHINGRIHRIHENLWQFLKQMWLDKKFHLYWTDALCINQNDVQERNKQVRHMDIVYRQAKCVIAWLGRSSSYEEDLQIISLVAEGIWPGWLAEPPASALSQQKVKRLRTVCKQISGRTTTNPYWERIWILQELILATEGMVGCWKPVDTARPLSFCPPVQPGRRR